LGASEGGERERENSQDESTHQDVLQANCHPEVRAALAAGLEGQASRVLPICSINNADLGKPEIGGGWSMAVHPYRFPAISG
jgi:hypothetical protein